MPDLAPCPFCGSEKLRMTEGPWYVECADCGVYGPDGTNEYGELPEGYEMSAVTRWHAAPRREKEQTPSLRSGGEG